MTVEVHSIERLQAMDERAWGELQEDYHRRIYFFVNRYVTNHQTAEDITQDVFLGAVRGIANFDSAYTLDQFVFGIAKNRVIDHYRKKKPATVSADTIPAEYEEDDGARREIATCLHSFLAMMDDHDREILTLVEFEDKTQKQAAEALGLTLPAVKSRHQRAKQKLRQKLEACCSYMFDGRGKILDYEIKDSD